jgi:transmembrane sensor
MLPKVALMSEEGGEDSARIEREAYDWVRRFSTGSGRSADIDELKHWVARSPAHRQTFERVSRAWQGLNFVGRDFPASSDVRSVPVRPRVDRRLVLGLGGTLAASAAVIGFTASPPLGLWPSWSELSADYSTRPGERRKITLRDKVAVELNTRTSISLQSAGGKSNDFVLISGEAMVTTPPKIARPVTVVAGNGRIIAADARFNVSCFNQTVHVTCLEGEVRIEREKTIFPLQAGRQVTYSDRGIEPSVAIDASVVTAWQNDLVIFRATPVSEVIAEVNRYCPGKIILTNATLGQRRLNARFRIEDMNKVIGQIEQIFGAHATALPYGIVLLG